MQRTLHEWLTTLLETCRIPVRKKTHLRRGAPAPGECPLQSHGKQRGAPSGETVDAAHVPHCGGHGASELRQPQSSPHTVHLLSLSVSHAQDVLRLVEDEAVHHIPVSLDVVQVLALRREHGHSAVAVTEQSRY